MTHRDPVESPKAGHRRTRVLHIGNIANNAYINAKLLNDAGYDCDVLCADYYHIMGCPEWEDADFDGEVGDHFFPQWWRLDLGGFQRPRWFAQGPRHLAMRYLIARRTGNAAEAKRLWNQLCHANNSSPPAQDGLAAARLSRLVIDIRLKLSRIHSASDLFTVVWGRLDIWAGPSQMRRIVASLVAFLFVATTPITVIPVVTVKLLRRVQRWFSTLRQFRGPKAAMVWVLLSDFARKRGAWAWLVVYLVAPIATLVAILQQSVPRVIGERRKSGTQPQDMNRVAQLSAEFTEAFPGRDALTISDVFPFLEALPLWEQLFAQYDVIIGYSTDGFYPLLAGQPYLAFEHGTLREIPFRETGEGRRTALTYRCARHVFVTNFDCAANAERLAPGRHTEINHPFDEDHGLAVGGFELWRRQLRLELESDYLFFFPTRHDWVQGTGYADKGNDVFLRAFASIRQMGHRLGLVCCEWGANVGQSKALLQTLGVAGAVKWIAPLPTIRFERMSRACDCVVDQFVLGSFGGVMFKAMAVGAPVLTYLEESKLLQQYSEVPPVINCRTEDDIVRAIDKLIRDPRWRVQLGHEARSWMMRHHGKRQTVAAQAQIFESMRDTLPAPTPTESPV